MSVDKLYNKYMNISKKSILTVTIFMIFSICSSSNISESQRNTCIYQFGKNVLDYGIAINTISETFGDTTKFSIGEKVFRAIPKKENLEDIIQFEKIRATTNEIYESKYGKTINQFDTFTKEYVQAVGEIGGGQARPYFDDYEKFTRSKIQSQIIKQLLLKEDKNAENYCDIFLSIEVES